MAYGTRLFEMGDAARQRGLTASEAATSRLLQAASQANSQMFQSNQADKQRKFQEDQQKKQEAAQKKQMWTSLGINAGTGAVGGAITGGMAASMAPAVAAPMNFGPQMAGGAGAPIAANVGAMAAPSYTPFAGGNVAGGAAAGGALGALGGLSGQNYLAPALAMPAENYALASNAFNTANNQALGWANFGQKERMNDADNTAANERARMMSESRNYGVDTNSFARMYNSDRGFDKAMIPYNQGPTPYQQGQLDLGGRRADIAGQGMDLRGDTLANTIRHQGVTEDQGERATGAKVKNADTFSDRGLNGGLTQPKINMGPNGANVSGTDLDAVRNTYNQINPPPISNDYKGATIRVGNHLDQHEDPTKTIDFMLKSKYITTEQADDLKRRAQAARQQVGW